MGLDDRRRARRDRRARHGDAPLHRRRSSLPRRVHDPVERVRAVPADAQGARELDALDHRRRRLHRRLHQQVAVLDRRALRHLPRALHPGPPRVEGVAGHGPRPRSARISVSHGWHGLHGSEVRHGWHRSHGSGVATDRNQSCVRDEPRRARSFELSEDDTRAVGSIAGLGRVVAAAPLAGCSGLLPARSNRASLCVNDERQRACHKCAQRATNRPAGKAPSSARWRNLEHQPHYDPHDEERQPHCRRRGHPLQEDVTEQWTAKPADEAWPPPPHRISCVRAAQFFGQCLPRPRPSDDRRSPAPAHDPASLPGGNIKR